MLPGGEHFCSATKRRCFLHAFCNSMFGLGGWASCMLSWIYPTMLSLYNYAPTGRQTKSIHIITNKQLCMEGIFYLVNG